MKTIIVAMNSKFIHSSLAVWYLKTCCRDEYGEIKILEFTINDNPDWVLASIYQEKADVIAFSCYIWNIGYVLRLAECLKKVADRTIIVLGGPEVSFDAEELLLSNNSVNYVISGEGERTFKLLISSLSGLSGKNIYAYTEIDGLSYRNGSTIISNQPASLIENLDEIPSPYTVEMLSNLGGRMAYFESSRGCPFSCSYCISSTTKGVRYFSFDRVRSDLEKLIRADIKQVKFVDRTFNCNKSRAKDIFRFIIKNGRDTNFHFETAADLFDDEMLDILSKAPAGLIQFEIGIQTANIKTHEAIDRITDLDKAFLNIKRLIRIGNMHIHLDLIAGLPYEGYESFSNSFNLVYSLKPHCLQLGFLKMLKGSKIRKEAEIHGYVFKDYPPYEVLCNKYMSFEEMLELKGIEKLLEKYHNSGRFVRTLDFIINGRHLDVHFNSAFAFFKSFYIFCRNRGYLEHPLSSREIYIVLAEFLRSVVCKGESEIMNELLKFDFLSSDNSGKLPEGVVKEAYENFQEYCFDFLKDVVNINLYLPHFTGVSPKQIYKHIHFEVFSHDVVVGFEHVSREHVSFEHVSCKPGRTIVLFDYSHKNKVSGLYPHFKLPS